MIIEMRLKMLNKFIRSHMETRLHTAYNNSALSRRTVKTEKDRAFDGENN